MDRNYRITAKEKIILTTDKRLRRKAISYESELKVTVNNPVLWLMEITN